MAISERPRILFVEDERSIAEPFSKALAREGFEPHLAGTAARALELAERIDPDLILLDLHLPDMPGQEVLRRLRAEPRTAEVPVLILSADARPSLIKELLAQGGRAFLTKPLDVKELLQHLDGVAAERGQGRNVNVEMGDRS